MFDDKFNPFNVKDELKSLTLDEIRAWQSSNAYPFSIAVYHQINDFNLAGVVRNACAFGLSKMYIIGIRKWDKRGAVGAYNYIDICHYHSFQDFLQSEDVVLAPLELPEHYPQLSPNFFKPIQEIDPIPNTCILLGLESSGLLPEHLQVSPSAYYVPQSGCMRSLNAAVASGIAMSYLIDNYKKSNILSYGT